MAIRKNINELGKNSAIYGAGNVLNKFAAFLLIPIYTRYLSTADVGIFALLEMFEKLMITVASLGTMQAIWRYISSSSNNDKSRIVFSGFIWTMGINIIIFTLLVLANNNLITLFGLERDTGILFLLASLNIFLTIGGQFILSLWQYYNKALNFILLSLFQFLGILFLSIFFVAFKGQGLYGLLLSKAIVLFIVFLLSASIIFINYRGRPDFSIYKKLLKFGAPLILLALVTPMLTLSSRAYLLIFVSLEDIGIYHIGYKFGMLINMFLVVPLQRGWVPIMYKMEIDDSTLRIHRDVMYYYTVIGFLFCVALIFFIEPLLSFIAQPQYLSGAPFVTVIAFAYFISGYRLFFMAGATLKGKTPRIAIAAGITVLANIILNYFLIKFYGTWGAAWSTLFSYIILVVLVFIASNKLIKIKWDTKRLIKVTIITFLFLLVNNFINDYFPFSQLLISILAFIVYIYLLFAFRIIDKREINGMKLIIKKLKKI